MSTQPVDQTWVCDRCGATVHIGDFPLCKGNPSDHGPWLGAEEPLEPYNDWQLTPEPGPGPRITTRHERRKIMAQHGLDYHKNKFENAGRLYFDMGRGR